MTYRKPEILNRDAQASENLFSFRLLRALKWTLFFLLCLLSYFVISVALIEGEQISLNLDNSRAALALKSFVWTGDLIETFNEKHEWLKNYGLRLEISIFEKIGTIIFDSAQTLDFQLDQVGFILAFVAELHFAMVKISFITLSTWRVWIAFGLFGFVLAKIRLKPYFATNLLGLSGSGRIYDSSILISNIKTKNPSNKIFPSFTSASTKSYEAIRKSNLYKMLQPYEAINRSNIELIGIILFHDAVLVPSTSPDSTLDTYDLNISLQDYAEVWIKRCLELHVEYQNSESKQYTKGEVTDTRFSVDNKINVDLRLRFSETVRMSIDRVLSPKLKSELININTSVIATLVLTQVAAKALTLEKQGARWNSTSIHPELTARSLLHSLSFLSVEYSSQERKLLRQALVLSSRRGLFAQTRMPSDLTEECKSLRAWSELLLAAPNKLETHANSLELFVLIDEIHERWKNYLLMLNKSSISPSSSEKFLSCSEFVYIPVSILERIFSKLVQPRELDRLTMLYSVSDQSTALRGGEPSRDMQQQLLIGVLKIKALSRQHNIDEDSLLRWSVYRLILHSFGWLAGKVEQVIIPESFLVYGRVPSELRSVTQNGTKTDSNSVHIQRDNVFAVLRLSRFRDLFGRIRLKILQKIENVDLFESKEESQLLDKHKELTTRPLIF